MSARSTAGVGAVGSPDDLRNTANVTPIVRANDRSNDDAGMGIDASDDTGDHSPGSPALPTRLGGYWPVDCGAPFHPTSSERAPAAILDASFSADGRYLVIGDTDGRATVYSVMAGAKSVSAPFHQYHACVAAWFGCMHWVCSVACLPVCRCVCPTHSSDYDPLLADADWNMIDQATLVRCAGARVSCACYGKEDCLCVLWARMVTMWMWQSPPHLTPRVLCNQFLAAFRHQPKTPSKDMWPAPFSAGHTYHTLYGCCVLCAVCCVLCAV